MMSIVKLDINVSDDIEAGALKLLAILRPTWIKDEIKFTVCTEGVTNRLLACQHKSDVSMSEMLLVRVYGEKTDLIIDRNAELQNMQLMHLIGCCKPVYARFENGIVYGFMPGECLDQQTITDPHIAKLIAKEMVRMHGLDPVALAVDHPELKGLDTSPMIVRKIRNHIDIMPLELTDPSKNKRFQAEIPNKSELLQELEEIIAEVETLNSPIVFTHNDLLMKNIVYNKENDRTYFIDYEYGGFNYQAYDIASHFCEHAGIHNLDFSHYPDKDYQLVWLRNYLEFQFERDGKNPNDVTEVDVERLYVQACKFSLMTHLFWVPWAVVQAQYSTIDFDYLNRAIIRLQEYYKRKREFLALKMP